MVHLCSRPLPNSDRCILGRETAIQKVEWREDYWLHLADGGNRPKELVALPRLAKHPWESEPERDEFDGSELGIHFQTPESSTR